jgi:hypothetical protein
MSASPATIRAGCLASARSRATQSKWLRVAAAMRRTGGGHLLKRAGVPDAAIAAQMLDNWQDFAPLIPGTTWAAMTEDELYAEDGWGVDADLRVFALAFARYIRRRKMKTPESAATDRAHLKQSTMRNRQ